MWLCQLWLSLTVKGYTQAAGVSMCQDRRAAASVRGPCEGAQRTTLRQAQAELDTERLHLLYRLPQLVTVLDRLPKTFPWFTEIFSSDSKQQVTACSQNTTALVSLRY